MQSSEGTGGCQLALECAWLVTRGNRMWLKQTAIIKLFLLSLKELKGVSSLARCVGQTGLFQGAVAVVLGFCWSLTVTGKSRQNLANLGFTDHRAGFNCLQSNLQNPLWFGLL